MPIYTDDLLYGHMPKTGGLWVAHVLLARGGQKVPNLRRHSPLTDVPEEYTKDRLLVGSVRDPWSWYVSLWQHLRAAEDGQRLLAHLDRKKGTFKAFIEGVTDPGIWLRAPVYLTEGWWDWPVGGGGLWAETFRSLYGRWGLFPNVLIDTPQLREGLSELLGEQVGEPAQNTAQHRPETAVADPRALYEDNEARALVACADGDVAARLGYLEPYQRLREPLLWCQGLRVGSPLS